ncbi:MAG: hypothetical protein R3Y05_02340 [bacterium]
MDKEYFLATLKSRIAYLSEEELKKYLDYYENEINKRISNGLDEYAAVKEIGPIIDIIYKIKNKSTETIVVTDNVIEIEKEENIIIENKPSRKKVIIATSPLWSIAAIVVGLFMILMYVSGLTLFSSGIIMFFTTFTSLGSPLSTIIFGLGSGLCLFGLAIISIPLALFITNIIVGKYKHYYAVLKEELK